MCTLPWVSGGAKLVAYWYDNKFSFFQAQLFVDAVYALIALGIIFTMMSWHSGSVFITSCAFLQM